MKTKVVSIFLILAFFATTITANALNPVVGSPEKGMKQLKKKIANFLYFPYSKKVAEANTYVKVIFAINDESKIDLINVISDNEEFATHVKTVLQGKKVEVAPELIGGKYTVKINFKDFDQFGQKVFN